MTVVVASDPAALEQSAAPSRAEDAPPDEPAAPGLRAVGVLAAIGLAVWLAVFTPGAWASVAALVLGLAVVWRTATHRHQAIFMALGIAAVVASVDYLGWRLQVLNLSALWIAVPLLLAEAFGILHAAGIVHTLWPRPEPKLTLTEDATTRPIFIFIPTVNEGVAVLRRTIVAAQVAAQSFTSTYPGASVSVVICNDGFVAGYPTWREVDDLAKELGVRCVTRQVSGGAKAGNIEHARQSVGGTGDALLVVFDADQVAEPDFLLRTVPLLGDPRLGWVQTGQYYSNLENPVARWAEDQQAIFYRLLCQGKSRLNSAFICGTNVVLRARALDEIGGLPTDSVTEDFAASLRLHGRWRSVFVPGVLATGLGPMDFASYLKQQRRWAIGTLSTIRTHGRDIFLGGRGLAPPQRIQYALAATHYLSGLKDLIFILSPVIFLIWGVPAVQGLPLETFLWHFLPFLLLSQLAFWWYAARVTSWRGVLMGLLSAPTLVGALVTVVSGRRVGFAVTAKARAAALQWRHLAGHLALALCGLISLGLSLSAPSPSSLVSVTWVVYSMLCLSTAAWLTWQDFRQLAPAGPRYAIKRSWKRSTASSPRPADELGLAVSDPLKDLRRRVAADLQPLVTTSRNATRFLLALVLALQLALMLLLRNGVFQDEALYLYQGRSILTQFLTGTQPPEVFGRYTSGLPYFYPVLAGLLDHLGGLELARALSMVCMLGATIGIFQAARRLYGDRVGLLAAAVVATSAQLAFVGRLATYDALAIALLTAAFASAMKTSRHPIWQGCGIALLLSSAALAKYAAVIFGVVVVVAYLIRVFGRQGRVAGGRAVSGLGLGGSVMLTVAYLVTRFDDSWLQGLFATTANRQVHAAGERLTILLHAAGVLAIPLVLVTVGVVGLRAQVRSWDDRLLPLVLGSALLLAPLYHIAKIEPTSLDKHLGYGLLIAAPVIGHAIAKLTPMSQALRWHSMVAGVALLALPAVLSAEAAQRLYHAWPDPGNAVVAVEPLVQPSSRVLAEEIEVLKYRLAPEIVANGQLTGTDFFEYPDPAGITLAGLPAYRAAISHGHFDVVAFRNGPGASVAEGVADLLPQRYTLVAELPFTTSAGEGSYRIWRLSD